MIPVPRSVIAVLLVLLAGCSRGGPSIGRLDAVWGRQGISEGRFQKPRAIAIDRQDHLYIVDMTARIQVLTTDGEYLRQWETPDHAMGRPTGLTIDRDGNVLVADTHYYRVLIYSPEGKLLRTLGGTKGQRPGEFGLVTGIAQDSRGQLLRVRIRRVRPHPEVHARGRVSSPMGRARLGAGPVHPPAETGLRRATSISG